MSRTWKDMLTASFQKLNRLGGAAIFSSSVICNVLTFIGGMVVVRVMSKEDYGTYTYIMNCYGMLMLLSDFGCSVASMQFCSENCKNPIYFNDYFTYGFKRGLMFSSISSLLILCSPLFYPFQTEQAAKLSASLFLLPFVVVSNSFILVCLRTHLESKRYSAIKVFHTVIHYLLIMPLTIIFGIRGAVWSNYLIYTCVLVFSLAVSRNYVSYSWKRCCLSREEKKSFLKLAFASQLNNGISSCLHLADVFFIGLMIGSSGVISSYKVATTIPNAMAFIPTALMVCVVPYFSRNIQNISWVKKQSRRLMLVSAAVNGAISIGLILLAAWILPLIFGTQYQDAVLCFRIMMVGYFFYGTVQIPIANILYTQRQVRWNIILTVISGVTNCILDVIFIFFWGSLGAAAATTMVQIISAVCHFQVFRRYIRKQEQSI